MEILLGIIAVIAGAFADRVRGGGLGVPEKLRSLYVGHIAAAIILAYCAGYAETWILFAMIFAYIIGEAPGYGHPLGRLIYGDFHKMKFPTSQPERFQELFKIENNDWISIVVRGIIWGIPFVPLGIVDWRFFVMPFVFMLAFLVAGITASLMADDGDLINEAWAAHEYARGAVATLLTLLLFI